MSMNKNLQNLCHDIEKAILAFNKDSEWQALDKALDGLCGPFANSTTQYVLPKVVAVDRLYRADIIRYLPKPKYGEKDLRPLCYGEIADGIIDLDLDTGFEELEKLDDNLSLRTIGMIATIHSLVSNVVHDVTGHSADVFASKYLHFCKSQYFPIMDSRSWTNMIELMTSHDSGGMFIIPKRFGFDEAKKDYDKQCRAILSIQQALMEAESKHYSLRELDKFLY